MILNVHVFFLKTLMPKLVGLACKAESKELTTNPGSGNLSADLSQHLDTVGPFLLIGYMVLVLFEFNAEREVHLISSCRLFKVDCWPAQGSGSSAHVDHLVAFFSSWSWTTDESRLSFFLSFFWYISGVGQNKWRNDKDVSKAKCAELGLSKSGRKAEIVVWTSVWLHTCTAIKGVFQVACH